MNNYMSNYSYNRYYEPQKYNYYSRCGEPQICNGYRFPAPKHKEMKRLDVSQVTIHTDINIFKKEIYERCDCEPVIVKEAKKSLVLSACTDCLERNEYYTLNIDRDIPIHGYDVYINVEPKNFNKGEVGLVYTEVEHFAGCGKYVDLFENPRDTINSLEIDGENSYANKGNNFGQEYDDYGYTGIAPADPAFPSQGCYGCGFRTKSGVLIPLVLDLHGNICVDKNLSTGRYPANGYKPYNNMFTLYLNNAGQFVLCRPNTRRSDFA